MVWHEKTTDRWWWWWESISKVSQEIFFVAPLQSWLQIIASGQWFARACQDTILIYSSDNVLYFGLNWSMYNPVFFHDFTQFFEHLKHPLECNPGIHNPLNVSEARCHLRARAFPRRNTSHARDSVLRDHYAHKWGASSPIRANVAAEPLVPLSYTILFVWAHMWNTIG